MNFFIWAFIVSIISSLIVYLWLGYWLKYLRHVFLYILICIPLSAFVNLCIKRPVGMFLISLLNLKEAPQSWPIWFLPIVNLLAPLTEEAIKILPLIFNEVRAYLRNGIKALYLGFFFGACFGIGEAWYLAFSFTASMRELAKGDFLLLTGFFGERFLCVFIHGYLTALVLIGYNKSLTKSYLVAAMFHYLLNIGPLLYQKGLISAEVAYIPIGPVLIMFFHYIFKMEKKLREERPFSIEEKVLLKRNKE